MPEIRAHWNCDHVYVVWRYDGPISECRGFALERGDADGNPQGVVNTWVGFEDEVADAGSRHPSTEWPIQRYTWADFEVKPGQTWRYRAVPMLGPQRPLRADHGNATEWTDPVTVSPSDKHGMSAFFNRGIVQTQWLARRLGEHADVKPADELKTIIHTPGDATRNFLGGELRKAMLDLLDEVANEGKTVYAALFELNDPELLPRLAALGPRAHVVLANGDYKPENDLDENSDARHKLGDAHVDVRDRKISAGLSHNKFAVVCAADGKTPERVWTGSTNWTETGLCTQANNGLLVESEDVAARFLEQWGRLAQAGNDPPKSLADGNTAARPPATVDGIEVTTWFAPTNEDKALVDHHPDIHAVRQLVDGAKDGIVFLMFYPGKNDSLLNYIANRGTEGQPGYDPNLYIHGVINQSVGTVQLVRRGQVEPANMEILTPAGLDDRFGFWIDEVGHGGVNVHSKVIVIDPFGDDPVVVTGSHNLGQWASGNNDDNLVIIRGSNALAAAYAVNVIGVYTQYRWRYIRKQADDKKAAAGRRFPARDAAPADTWSGLQDEDGWQDGHFDGPRLRELEFWLGHRIAAPVPAPAGSTETRGG